MRSAWEKFKRKIRRAGKMLKNTEQSHVCGSCFFKCDRAGRKETKKIPRVIELSWLHQMSGVE
jgi:hypothetical protein